MGGQDCQLKVLVTHAFYLSLRAADALYFEAKTVDIFYCKYWAVGREFLTANELYIVYKTMSLALWAARNARVLKAVSCYI